jgi:hypothetical protein
VAFYISRVREYQRIVWLCVGEYRGRSVKGFIGYTVARIQKEIETKAYRIYVTDSLLCGLNAFRKEPITQRYADIIEWKQKEEDTRSGDEIVADLMRRAGLKFESS